MYKYLTIMMFIVILAGAKYLSDPPKPDRDAVIVLLQNWDPKSVQVWLRGDSEWGLMGYVQSNEAALFVVSSNQLAGSHTIQVMVKDTLVEGKYIEFPIGTRLPNEVLLQHLNVGNPPKLEEHIGQ